MHTTYEYYDYGCLCLNIIVSFCTILTINLNASKGNQTFNMCETIAKVCNCLVGK